MPRRLIAGVVVVAALAAGCGSDRVAGGAQDAKGVRDAMVAFDQLAREGQGSEACKTYTTDPDSCRANLREPQIGWTERLRLDRTLVAKIDHDHATYSVPGHPGLSGTAVYADGRWKFDF